MGVKASLRLLVGTRFERAVPRPLDKRQGRWSNSSSPEARGHRRSPPLSCCSPTGDAVAVVGSLSSVACSASSFCRVARHASALPSPPFHVPKRPSDMGGCHRIKSLPTGYEISHRIYCGVHWIWEAATGYGCALPFNAIAAFDRTVGCRIYMFGGGPPDIRIGGGRRIYHIAAAAGYRIAAAAGYTTPEATGYAIRRGHRK